VALLATFMGICKIKDDNICQAMQQAQADKIDHWSYYQARNVRQEVAEATATQLRLQQASQPASAQAAYAEAIARYDQVAKDQAQKKQQVAAQADATRRTTTRSTTATTSSTCPTRCWPSPSRCWPSRRSRSCCGCTC